MASSRRVSNDAISQPLLPAQLCSALLWAVTARADILFGVEQPNEQQTEVRNVAPTALPSDYHTKTFHCVCVRVCVYLSIRLCERVRVLHSLRIAVRKSGLFTSQSPNAHTHTQSERHVSNEERGIKVKRATALHSEEGGRGGERGEKKGGREGCEVRRVEGKKGRWKAGAGVLRPPGNF